MSLLKDVSYSPYSTAYSHALIDHLPCHQDIFHRVMAFFGFAVHFHDKEHNISFYIRVKDLVAHLCDTPNADISGSALATSKKLRRLALEAIHPITTKPATIADLHSLFEHFRQSALLVRLHEATRVETSVEAAAKALEAAKGRHLDILEYNPSELMYRLRPGDIFFKKQPHETWHPVVFGQWIASFFRRQDDREAYKFSHVAIYLGNGKIGEATPNHGDNEVRVVKLEDSRFALQPGSPIQYVVVRHTDPELARQAAEVAEQIATRNCDCAKKEGHQYTYRDAVFSSLLPHNFGPFARYRYIKQWLLDREGERPKDLIKEKDFFCSYYVAYALQVAEGQRVMQEMIGRYDTPSDLNDFISRGKWGYNRVIALWKKMNKEIKLAFDAKRVTPQDLINLVAKNPDSFRNVHVIRAAPAA